LHVTVMVAVVSTDVPGRTLTVPNAVAVMLTEQDCASAGVETSIANKPSELTKIRLAIRKQSTRNSRIRNVELC
jgi:hypothetical protein